MTKDYWFKTTHCGTEITTSCKFTSPNSETPGIIIHELPDELQQELAQFFHEFIKKLP